MIINFQQLISILPILIIGLTIIIILLCITFKCNYFNNFFIVMSGLNLAFISLLLIWHHGIQNITPLIYIDHLSIFYMGIILISSILINILVHIWLINYYSKCSEFYLLLLIATMGCLVLITANHLATLFLGIELLSLPLIGMIGYDYNQKAYLQASIKYMILSTVALSFIIFGIALIYLGTGTLSLNKIAYNINYIMMHKPLLTIGLGMILVGVGFKLALVPFHLWTPDIYKSTSFPVLAFLSISNKIAIFIASVRLFNAIAIINNAAFQLLLAIVAVCSMLFGSLMALNQYNIKCILGYSSIVHLGYLLVGVIAIEGNNNIAFETINICLISYLFSNLGIFGIFSILSTDKDKNLLSSYRGLFWQQPILSLFLTCMLLSLAGIPMTLGFIGKFYLFVFSIKSQLWWITGTILLSSIISLLYYLRIVINLYLSPYTNKFINITSSTDSNIETSIVWTMLVACIFIIIVGGIYPEPIINLIKFIQPMIIIS